MRLMHTLGVMGVLGAMVLVGGCGSSPRVISPGERAVTVSDINMSDWENAATELLDSLLASGRLPSDGNPARVRVSRIVNDTSERVNIALLTEHMLTELNRSGRAQAVRWDDNPTLAQQREVEEFMGERDVQVRDFDFAIGGRIIQDRVRQGRTNESTFVFTITLDDPNTGTSVWQDQFRITKAERRGLFGF